MEYFKIFVRKSDQQFVSISKVVEDQVTGYDLDQYSVLVTDEATARANFTLTGHLPSETFETLLSDAKAS